MNFGIMAKSESLYYMQASKTGVTGTGFPFGTCQRILFMRLRMQKHRKIAAYLLVARVEHLLWRTADHHPISVFDR